MIMYGEQGEKDMDIFNDEQKTQQKTGELFDDFVNLFDESARDPITENGRKLSAMMSDRDWKAFEKREIDQNSREEILSWRKKE